MEWLAQNLSLAYPFADSVTGQAVTLFADALVTAGIDGPYQLETFEPNGLTNARVRIMKGSTILLNTFVATATTMGDYTILEGTDSTLASSFRFVLDTTQLSLFPGLSAAIEFVPAACAFNGTTVPTLNGVSGNVIVSLPDHCIATVDGQLVTLAFSEPEDRVDCSAVDCDSVYTINNLGPDPFGSVTVSPDGCYRVVPHPTDATQLLLFNFCAPCLDCDDVETLDSKFVDLSNYYYQLAAIYHDQFNRSQRGLAKANTEILTAETRGVVTSNGLVDVSGRSFSRPYFSQLSLALLNATPYHVSISLVVSITPSGVASQLQYLADTSLLQRFQVSGNQFTPLADLPGTVTITLDPQEQVAVATEVQRTSVDTLAPGLGYWHVVATVTFTSGPGTLPGSATLTRDYPLELKAGA